MNINELISVYLSLFSKKDLLNELPLPTTLEKRKEGNE
jgi:hypothetical protein